MAVREKPGKKITFLINYTEKPQVVRLSGAFQNALTGGSEPEEVSLAPFDVKVLTTQ